MAKDSENIHENSPVLKALRLLIHLARQSESVSLADLSRALDLPKPTSHRLALMLSDLGFVQKDPVALRYSLGPIFEELALAALRNSVSSTARRLLMDELSQRLGVRTNLTVLKAGKLLYVEWVESSSVLRVDLKPGAQVPVHCSASGKLLMAFAPEDLRARFLKSGAFEAYTKSTITTAKALEHELVIIQRRGYAEDNQEFLSGVCCLAVPVRNRNGEVVAGLAVMAPEASMPIAKARKHLPAILQCAEAISKQFGWSVSSTTEPRSSSEVEQIGSADSDQEKKQSQIKAPKTNRKSRPLPPDRRKRRWG
jgi:IclR family transcriptional regulator, acetate operon repressor